MRWWFAAAVLFWSASAASQNYEGKWNRTFLQFSVTVQSWGDDCGVMPRSYSSRKIKTTEILQNNGHLFFSTGGLRTDRCNSPNPALVTLATSRSANMWTRTCETPQSASKFERIDYTFDGNRDVLTYEATSSFDWTLNSDRCKVSWVEKRTYQRVSEGSDAAAVADGGASPILKVHEDASFAEGSADGSREAGCEPTGKLKRLIIVPQDVTISPSERLCFQVRGVDSSGCRFAVSPVWSVSQNGVARNDLIDNRGCFTAGDNAAETDGVYQIDARFKGENVTTTLEISYPDVGDLARARLDLDGEIGDELVDSEVAVLGSPVSPPALGSASSVGMDGSRKKDATDPLLITLLIVAVVVLIVLLISMAWLLKKQRNEDREPSGVVRGSSPDLLSHSTSGSLRAPEKMCPTCKARFPLDAKYCPADASELQVVGANLRSSIPPPKGMICPTCKRGYDIGSKFCPHDSTALVEYEKWRRM
ncbi:MAG: zinc ribbon domain-containing protein [Deltaproteobacteria bacterium]|nr:zinc ribbon domain-containing protein [Deltaproteobacteria bacterium]MBN2672158.1 zinc ribbon domain-containing protein [Deltaproteobacteria bacterium]